MVPRGELCHLAVAFFQQADASWRAPLRRRGAAACLTSAHLGTSLWHAAVHAHPACHASFAE